jgi:predicted esterase
MKKLIIIFLFLPIIGFAQFCDSLLLQSITNPGQFTVNSFDENSGILNGSNFSGSTIFYPLNTANVMLPCIVMVPGFMNTELTIQNWGSFFASYGIVTMTIGTNLLTDGHIERRDALLDAIISLKNENLRLSSPLYGKIDTSSIAVGGFSKGGGGAQLVAAIDPNIKAIISLYPWLDNPTISELNHSVPVIIISGQLDIIAPPSLHANIHYNYTPNTTDKLKYEIAFASHDAISGPYAGNGEVGVRVLSWLQTYLLGDSCYCPIITLNAITSSSYETNVECNIINVNTIEPNTFSYRKLLKITNIFGNEINATKNTPLFYIYDDGTVEKKLTIE